MLILFIILVLFSAFFSASETALFNLKTYDKANKRVNVLLKNPKRLLVSLLTGNTIVNIGLGSIAASYTVYLHSNNFQNISLSVLLLIEVVFVTILILIFGEVLPKTYAIKKSLKTALKPTQITA